MMMNMLYAILLGTGATLVMDAAVLVRRWVFGIPSLDYGLVGRWVAYLFRGRFRHDPIGATAPVRHERLLGWLVHYLTGIVFAGILLTVWGIEWLHRPSITPALTVGFGTAMAPFFLMQPGMGFGIAASRAPKPGKARLQTLITHGIFGVGLYVSGWGVYWMRF